MPDGKSPPSGGFMPDGNDAPSGREGLSPPGFSAVSSPALAEDGGPPKLMAPAAEPVAAPAAEPAPETNALVVDTCILKEADDAMINNSGLPCFYCRGAWDPDAMTFADRTLCRMLQKAVAKKKPEDCEIWEKALLEAGDQKHDWTDKAYLTPVLKLLY